MQYHAVFATVLLPNRHENSACASLHTRRSCTRHLIMPHLQYEVQQCITITGNSSDEIANMNFLYDDIVYVL